MIPSGTARPWGARCLLLVAACGGARPVASQRAHPVEPAPSPTLEAERDAERPVAPMELKVALRINGAPRSARRDGDLVRSGDAIQLSIQTREAGHVLLAFCSSDRQLAWFPPRGSLRTSPEEVLIAPAPNASIIFDDNLGREALYVIVSRSELALADPALSQAIARSRGGEPAADCGHMLGQARVAPSIKGRHPTRAKTSQKVAPRSRAMAAAGQAAAGIAAATTTETEQDVPPDPVGLVRGASIRWDDFEQVSASGDSSGIAILRFGFRHVAAAR
jgi:hypothetical protein